MQPVVRHMLLCEHVRKRKNNPMKFDLLGYINILRPVGDFPLRVSLSVFLVLTGGRGAGQAQIRVIDADSDEIIYNGPEFELVFHANPTRIHASTIRITSCTFDRPGLCYVDFMYNGQRLAREDLLVKEFQ